MDVEQVERDTADALRDAGASFALVFGRHAQDLARRTAAFRAGPPGVPRGSRTWSMRVASGIVSSELSDRMALAVGFRNVLVHQYAVVDDRIVLAAVDRLGDFDDFVAQVSLWMTTPDT